MCIDIAYMYTYTHIYIAKGRVWECWKRTWALVLQFVAVRCSVLQCVAVCCSENIYVHIHMLQQVGRGREHLCCSVLQHVAVCCNENTYVRIHMLQQVGRGRQHLCCSVLQCVAVCYNENIYVHIHMLQEVLQRAWALASANWPAVDRIDIYI